VADGPVYSLNSMACLNPSITNAGEKPIDSANKGQTYIHSV